MTETTRIAPRPWWKGAVIYQIYPRSFADSNGDGIGDLPGITARLDHVASLGVDAIWLSPFFTSPMKDFGYDVADYRDVDPIFGTLADFDALVARAHELGLKVVIDQVYSHTSDEHPWFTESRSSRSNPRADWYVWADAKPDGSPPSNWQSVFGGPAWTWDAATGQYYYHAFLKEQPDLNWRNPDVRAAMLDVLRFWFARGIPPDIPVALRIGAARAAFDEPGMLIRAVIGHEVEQQLQSPRMGRCQQRVEIRQRPETRVDIAIIGDVISKVGHRRWKYRGKPDRVHAQFDQIVEPALDPAKVTDAVAIAVLKRPGIDLV